MCSHEVAVPIPYSLTKAELVLEDNAGQANLDEELERLGDVPEWLDKEEVVEIIMRSAILLKQTTGASLASCLRTASIWYNG